MRSGVFYKSLLAGFGSTAIILFAVYLPYQHIQRSILINELKEYAFSKVKDLSGSLSEPMYHINFFDVKVVAREFLDKRETGPEILEIADALVKAHSGSSEREAIKKRLSSKGYIIEESGNAGYRVWQRDAVIAFITVVNQHGRVIYDSQDRRRVSGFFELFEREVKWGEPGILFFREHFVVKSNIIYNSSVAEYHVGQVYVGVSLAGFNAKRARNTRLVVMILAGLAILIMIGQVLWSRHSALRIIGVSKAVSRILRGGEGPLEVDPGARDEFGSIATGLARVLQRNQNMFKFFTEASRQKIMSGEISLGGEVTEAAVVFIDIRAFTSFCEGRRPREVVNLLNEYFTAMQEIINIHGGIIDKFIGDAILAVFYDLPQRNSCIAALFCARKINERLKELNKVRFLPSYEVSLNVSIGINFGELISGNIGSSERMEFTVIGDTVNIAARLQNEAKENPGSNILLSESVVKRLNIVIECRFVSEGTIRGKEETVRIFEPVSIPSLMEMTERLAGKLEKSDIAFVRYYCSDLVIDPLLKKYQGAGKEERTGIINTFSELARIFPGKIAAAYGVVLSIEDDNRLVSKVLGLFTLCEGKWNFDQVIRFIGHENARVYANAVEAISSISNRGAIKVLKRSMKSRVPRIRANAAVAFFERGNIRGLKTLFSMVREKDEQFIASGLWGIAISSGLESFPREGRGLALQIRSRMKSLREHPSRSVRSQLERVIERTGWTLD